MENDRDEDFMLDLLRKGAFMVSRQDETVTAHYPIGLWLSGSAGEGADISQESVRTIVGEGHFLRGRRLLGG